MSIGDAFKGRKEGKFLCPVGLESLKLQGDMSTDEYSYMKLYITGCESSERDDCLDEREIAKTEINLNMIKAVPGLLTNDLSDSI